MRNPARVLGIVLAGFCLGIAGIMFRALERRILNLESLGAKTELATLEDLKSLSVAGLSSGHRVFVSGYKHPGDGGGGSFIFSDRILVDNGGTSIRPRSGDGVWIRDSSGPVNVLWFGATANDEIDDAAALQAAIDAVEAKGGGQVDIPAGDFRVGDTVRVSSPGINIVGHGRYSSQIRRLGDGQFPLLKFTAGQSQISNLRLKEDHGCFNKSALIELQAISDISLHNVWFYGGYDALFLDRTDNVQVLMCIFEASRRHEIYAYQASLVIITCSSFFGCGLDEQSEPSAIYFTADLKYSFRPAFATIVGNYFNYSRYGHFINAENYSSISITGNFFQLAGMYNPGTKDDIHIERSQGIAITGNVSSMEYNNYNRKSRGTRYCIYVNDSTNVQIGHNALEPGVLGISNIVDSR